MGRERIRSPQPRPPPVRCTKQTDLIVLQAAAANTPPVRSLISQQGPLSLPPSTVPRNFLPTRCCFNVHRARFLGRPRPPFPCGRQSHPAVLRVAKCARRHGWHLGQRHRNGPGGRGATVTQVQHLGRFRGRDLLHVSYPTRWLPLTFPLPLQRPRLSAGR